MAINFREEIASFRPYGGSDNWTSRVDGTGEKNKERWRVVATHDCAADFVQLEADSLVSGVRCEYVRPYWRQQIGSGLELTMPFEKFMRLCEGMDYSPTRAGSLGLMQSQH